MHADSDVPPLGGSMAELLQALSDLQAKHEARIEHQLEGLAQRLLSGSARVGSPWRQGTAWAHPHSAGNSKAAAKLPAGGQQPPLLPHMLQNWEELNGGPPAEAQQARRSGSKKGTKGATAKSDVVLFDVIGDSRRVSSNSSKDSEDGRVLQGNSRRQKERDDAAEHRGNPTPKKIEDRMKEIKEAEKVAYHYTSPSHKATTKYNITKSTRGFNSFLCRLHNACVELLSNRIFEITVSLLIVANAVTMGAQVEVEMQSTTSYSQLFKILEYFYMAAFMFELLIRIIAEGRFFLSVHNRAARWNLFDTTIVGMSLCDMIVVAASSSQPTAVSAVRLFRLLRLVRILRIIRVLRFFRELRVMVSGIMSSMKPLFFAVVLLIMIMYIFAMCILQMVATEQQDQADSSGILSESQFAELLLYFDSLPRTLMTLCQSILGGVDWGQVVEPLLKLHFLAGFLFFVYIAFGMLCVLNIVTGVFVETANKITAQDEEAYLLQELANRREWLDDVVHHFRHQDQDGSGEVDWLEFQESASKLEVQAWFRKVGIDLESECTEGLFNLFDFDGDGKVDIDEFVDALQQVRGPAKAIDMARVKYEVRMVSKQLVQLRRGGQRDGSGASKEAVAPTEEVMHSESSGSSYCSVKPVSPVPTS